MMETVLQYGLFMPKTATTIVAVALFSALAAGLSRRAKAAGPVPGDPLE
jgi:hypothetical protein